MDSFRDLRSFPDIRSTSDERDFTQMIKAIKVRHNNVVPMMALGLQQLKKEMDPKIVYEDLDEIHQFLDRFYMSRIGIRMLIGQPFLFCFLFCWSLLQSDFFSFLLKLGLNILCALQIWMKLRAACRIAQSQPSTSLYWLHRHKNVSSAGC